MQIVYPAEWPVRFFGKNLFFISINIFTDSCLFAWFSFLLNSWFQILLFLSFGSKHEYRFPLEETEIFPKHDMATSLEWQKRKKYIPNKYDRWFSSFVSGNNDKMLRIYQTPVGCIVLWEKKKTNQIEIRTSFGWNIFHFSHYLCFSIQSGRFFSIEALFLKYDAFVVFQFNGPSKWPTKKQNILHSSYTKA